MYVEGINSTALHFSAKYEHFDINTVLLWRQKQIP